MTQQTKSATGRSRAEDIADRLREAIHAHRLTPGAKLSEDEVGGIFEVSRTTTRAALHMLAHEQLVTIEPNRGAFVASPSIREAREVFEARALLEESVAARLRSLFTIFSQKKSVSAPL